MRAPIFPTNYNALTGLDFARFCLPRPSIRAPKGKKLVLEGNREAMKDGSIQWCFVKETGEWLLKNIPETAFGDRHRRRTRRHRTFTSNHLTTSMTTGMEPTFLMTAEP